MALSLRRMTFTLVGSLALATLGACVQGPVEPAAGAPTESAADTADAGDAPGPDGDEGGAGDITDDGAAGGPPEPMPSSVPGLTERDVEACSAVRGSDAEARQAYEALADLPVAEQDQAARDRVAAMFDQAAQAVGAELDRLSPSEVRSAISDYRSAQLQLADDLRSGGAASLGALVDAEEAVESACTAG